MKRFIYLSCLGLLMGMKIWAQLGPAYEAEDASLLETIDLFDQKQYSQAKAKFEDLENTIQLSDEDVALARFYKTRCAIELFHDEAPFLVEDFDRRYHHVTRENQLYFELARYYFRQKKFGKAKEILAELNESSIPSDVINEFYFYRGYCLFVKEEYEAARQDFFRVKDKPSTYQVSSQYYYAHINYQQKNYETSLNEFLKLQDTKEFSAIAPYYICQIYFLQEKFKDVIAFTPAFLETVTEKRKAEVARMVGESHYHLKQYKEALPYYETFVTYKKSMSESDLYQIGYTYYYNNDFEKAASFFERISNNDSEIGQNASYHLADCYLQLGEKRKALIAFEHAANTEYNAKIQEDATFNEAVLNYDIGSSAFKDAVKKFEQYLEKYPNSSRKDEAYKYMVQAFMNTKNYGYALNALSKINDKNDELKKAHQRVSFFRGLQLYNKGDFKNALKALSGSLNYASYDPIIKAQTLYWLGQTYYKLGKYQNAADQYSKFIYAPRAYQFKEYRLAHYNMGYAYFKLQKYSTALKWYRKFVDFKNHSDTKLLADGTNRVADMFYLKTDYHNASRYYEKAAALESIDADYALYKQGTSLGLNGKTEDKIKVLNDLMDKYPYSAYNDDAIYEAALGYQFLSESDKAKNGYAQIILDYPTSPYVKKSLAQLGLLHYNNSEYEKALRNYKAVLAKYPDSDEAANALKAIKNIYLEQKNVDTYIDYVEEMGHKVSVTEKDSLLFTNAENLYASNDCVGTVGKLKTYVEQYPESIFTQRAYLYLADCYKRQNDTANAIAAFDHLIGMGPGDFYETALLEVARLKYSSNQYDLAIANYHELKNIASSSENKLEAKLGLMRAYNLNKNYDSVEIVSQEILDDTQAGNSFKQEALYNLAIAQRKSGNPKAFENFKLLAENIHTEEGAEAKYNICEILYEKEQYEEAEKEVYNFIELKPSQQYWLAKSYILLSDIFMAKDDAFQAKHTLNSIIEYYENKDDGIIELAIQKKQRILEKEVMEYNDEEVDLEITLENL